VTVKFTLHRTLLTELFGKMTVRNLTKCHKRNSRNTRLLYSKDIDKVVATGHEGSRDNDYISAADCYKKYVASRKRQIKHATFYGKIS